MTKENLRLTMSSVLRRLYMKMLAFQYHPDKTTEGDFVDLFRMLDRIRTDYPEGAKEMSAEQQADIYDQACKMVYVPEEEIKRKMPQAFNIGSILSKNKNSKFAQYISKYVKNDTVVNFNARVTMICKDIDSRMSMISALCNYYDVIGADNYDTPQMQTLIDQVASSIYQLDLYSKNHITVYYPSPIKTLLSKRRVWHSVDVTFEEAESDVSTCWSEVSKSAK